MAVNQAFDMRQWYTSTKHLQVACWQLCEVCRRANTLHLRVGYGFPTSLLAGMDGVNANPQGGVVASRVPRVRARGVTWVLPSADLLSNPFDAIAEVEELRFCDAFDGSLRIQAWPHRLRTMEFGVGSRFNQPIVGVVWPVLLQVLKFGCSFNQPIEQVVWPNCLQQLTFWQNFNQPIERVQWPSALQHLTLGWDFNQPVGGVTWPASLQVLTFRNAFDQPIESVVWPASLQEMNFGAYFNRPIEGVTWPSSLRRLVFKGKFNQPIEGVIWPPLLQELTPGGGFNQPIKDVMWSTALQQLTFGLLFNQPIQGTVWPTSLQILTFGFSFNQPIDNVTWPMSLRQLTFGRSFNHRIDGATWPRSLEELTFGENFDQPIEGMEWPSLRRFTLAGKFRQSLQTLGTAMPTLEELTLQLDKDPARYFLLRGVEWPAGLTDLTISTGAYLRGVAIPPRATVTYRDEFQRRFRGEVPSIFGSTRIGKVRTAGRRG